VLLAQRALLETRVRLARQVLRVLIGKGFGTIVLHMQQTILFYTMALPYLILQQSVLPIYLLYQITHTQLVLRDIGNYLLLVAQLVLQEQRAQLA
jgi:hypothetical protein